MISQRQVQTKELWTFQINYFGLPDQLMQILQRDIHAVAAKVERDFTNTLFGQAGKQEIGITRQDTF